MGLQDRDYMKKSSTQRKSKPEKINRYRQKNNASFWKILLIWITVLSGLFLIIKTGIKIKE
jgi:hypothetical protein